MKILHLQIGWNISKHLPREIFSITQILHWGYWNLVAVWVGRKVLQLASEEFMMIGKYNLSYIRIIPPLQSLFLNYDRLGRCRSLLQAVGAWVVTFDPLHTIVHTNIPFAIQIFLDSPSWMKYVCTVCTLCSLIID